MFVISPLADVCGQKGHFSCLLHPLFCLGCLLVLVASPPGQKHQLCVAPTAELVEVHDL